MPFYYEYMPSQTVNHVSCTACTYADVILESTADATKSGLPIPLSPSYSKDTSPSSCLEWSGRGTLLDRLVKKGCCAPRASLLRGGMSRQVEGIDKDRLRKKESRDYYETYIRVPHSS